MPTLQLRMTARCGDHNGEATSRAATKYQRRSSVLLWARELHTAVTYGDNVPGMILSATLDVPGDQLAKNGLGCVDAVSYSVPPGHFASDRAYLPGRKPKDLALPLRKRGYSLVFDYNRTRAAPAINTRRGTGTVEGYRPERVA